MLFRAWPPDGKKPRRLGDSGQSRFIFHLFPGTVVQMDSPRRLCLDTVSPGLPVCRAGQKAQEGCKKTGRRLEITPVYQDGADLSALRLFAGSSGLVADFSRQLSEIWGRRSRL